MQMPQGERLSKNPLFLYAEGSGTAGVPQLFGGSPQSTAGITLPALTASGERRMARERRPRRSPKAFGIQREFIFHTTHFLSAAHSRIDAGGCLVEILPFSAMNGPMRDLTDVFWIKAKGVLFLLLGLLSGGLLLAHLPSLRIAALLLITIWAFCRAYYFAFYVIEKYVDPSFRFSGLGSAVKYLLRKNLKIT